MTAEYFVIEAAMEAADQSTHQQNTVIAMEVHEPGYGDDALIVPRRRINAASQPLTMKLPIINRMASWKQPWRRQVAGTSSGR